MRSLLQFIEISLSLEEASDCRISEQDIALALRKGSGELRIVAARYLS